MDMIQQTANSIQQSGYPVIFFQYPAPLLKSKAKLNLVFANPFLNGQAVFYTTHTQEPLAPTNTLLAPTVKRFVPTATPLI